MCASTCLVTLARYAGAWRPRQRCAVDIASALLWIASVQCCCAVQLQDCAQPSNYHCCCGTRQSSSRVLTLQLFLLSDTCTCCVRVGRHWTPLGGLCMLQETTDFSWPAQTSAGVLVSACTCWWVGVVVMAALACACCSVACMQVVCRACMNLNGVCVNRR